MAEVKTQGIKVKVDAAPGGVPAGSPSDMGVLLDLSELKKTRSVKKYNAVNSDTQVAVTGRLENGPITLSVIYDPEGTDGENKLETAIENNEMVQVSIELNNKPALGTNGTKYTALYYVSEFTKKFEQDGAVVADITIEINGTVTETAAA